MLNFYIEQEKYIKMPQIITIYMKMVAYLLEWLNTAHGDFWCSVILDKKTGTFKTDDRRNPLTKKVA